MRPLTSSELFGVWEQTLDQPLIARTIKLLELASGEHADIASLPIGERDARMFRLREWLFGNRMFQTATCPACSEKIEWETLSGDIQIHPGTASPRIIELSRNSYEVKFRLVNSADIVNLIKNKIPPEQSANYLLQHCILEVKKSGGLISKENLPAEIAETIEEEMSVRDPQADVQLNLGCPACHHQWQTGFNIMSFFWAEINHWAQKIMQEIFVLARFFGWSEQDILAMSPRRRQLYLQMINT